MEGVDRNRFRRPGLQIESFPVINIPQAENVTKERTRPLLKKHFPTSRYVNTVQKHGLLRSQLPLVNSKTQLQIRPITDYRFGRTNVKRATTANDLRNVRTKQTERSGKQEPRVFQELYKISFPCFSGCATCAFSQSFGPVRVYVSQYKKPKQLFADDIRDSQGRKVIPRDRIREFRGLVYDKDTNSCYPPIPKGYTSIYLNTAKKRRIIY